MQPPLRRSGIAMLAIAGILFSSVPVAALSLPTIIHGVVTDATSGAPLGDGWVGVGPVHVDRNLPNTNCGFTNGAGVSSHDFIKGSFTIPLTYELDSQQYQRANQDVVPSGDDTVADQVMSKVPGAPPSTGGAAGCTTATAGVPNQTLYLPNVTKTLRSPQGFQTPFIVQHSGNTSTTLEVTFYKFSDASSVTRRSVPNLAPGASFADVPNNDTDLPDNTQFSVTVRSFGNTVVSVVNQHKGSIEADAYSAAATGANTVFLPNVVRRFFGFHSPAIIQNLGQAPTVVTATYQSFDGTAPTKSFTRTISPGQSQFIEPNSDDPALGAPGLVDGKQYAVTLTSGQPISVVLNTHNDDPGVAQPVFYSANGISTGAATVYGAYAVKNANGNRVSTIVVENVGGAAVTPSLTFTPFGGGATQTFTAPAAIATGASWAFDPRFTNGIASSDSSKLCASASATCLGTGEYGFVANPNGGSIAPVRNLIRPHPPHGPNPGPTPPPDYLPPDLP